jgi:hypothetical protein
MKGRAYRRYMEDVKVIKRLKRKGGRSWYKWTDVNDINIPNPKWFDHIGTDYSFDYKTFTTDVWDTEYKIKWGLKGKKRKYGDSSDPWTRTKDKKRFYKDLDELGYKHIPSQFRRELED